MEEEKKKSNGSKIIILLLFIIILLMLCIIGGIIYMINSKGGNNNQASNIKQENEEDSITKVYESYLNNAEWVKSNLYVDDAETYSVNIYSNDIQKISYYVDILDKEKNESVCVVFSTVESTDSIRFNILKQEDGYVKVIEGRTYECAGYGINPDKNYIYICPNRHSAEEYDVFSYDNGELKGKYIVSYSFDATGITYYKDSSEIEEKEFKRIMNDDLGLSTDKDGNVTNKYKDVLKNVNRKMLVDAVSNTNQKITVEMMSDEYQKVIYDNMDDDINIYLAGEAIYDFNVVMIYDMKNKNIVFADYTVDYGIYQSPSKLKSAYVDDSTYVYFYGDVATDLDEKIKTKIWGYKDKIDMKSMGDDYAYIVISNESNEKIYNTYFDKYII
ncbi:MAG: hypothetical protein IKE91_04370 [Clostridia bacterium]|nr:hypothetical protein [Clostridia bacterium]